MKRIASPDTLEGILESALGAGLLGNWTEVYQLVGLYFDLRAKGRWGGDGSESFRPSGKDLAGLDLLAECFHDRAGKMLSVCYRHAGYKPVEVIPCERCSEPFAPADSAERIGGVCPSCLTENTDPLDRLEADLESTIVQLDADDSTVAVWSRADACPKLDIETYAEEIATDPENYHSEAAQRWLLANGTREQIIAWLCWNDHNGTFSDADSDMEGISRITLEQAREIMNRQICFDTPMDAEREEFPRDDSYFARSNL